MTVAELVEKAHSNAKRKGFWDNGATQVEAMSFAARVMLIVTELSEAIEAHRREDWNGVREEIADVFIRLGDLCGGTPELADIETAIRAKMRINKDRPRLHMKAY